MSVDPAGRAPQQWCRTPGRSTVRMTQILQSVLSNLNVPFGLFPIPQQTPHEYVNLMDGVQHIVPPG